MRTLINQLSCFGGDVSASFAPFSVCRTTKQQHDLSEWIRETLQESSFHFNSQSYFTVLNIGFCSADFVKVDPGVCFPLDNNYMVGDVSYRLNRDSISCSDQV